MSLTGFKKLEKGFVMMLFQVFYIECNKDKSHNVLVPME